MVPRGAVEKRPRGRVLRPVVREVGRARAGTRPEDTDDAEEQGSRLGHVTLNHDSISIVARGHKERYIDRQGCCGGRQGTISIPYGYAPGSASGRRAQTRTSGSVEAVIVEPT